MSVIAGQEATATEQIEVLSTIQKEVVENGNKSGSAIETSEELSTIQKEVVENGNKSGSAIETSETDESEQILYMIQNLSAREKRKTLLQLQPLMSSTLVDSASTTVRKVPEKEDASTSQNSSTIIVKSRGNPINPKLRVFSGITPTPTGHVSFHTWHKAATRLCRNAELADEEKIALIHNGLCQPALDLAQPALDSGLPTGVLSLLENVYGSVEDPRDLLNDFNATTMNSKEKPSDYLNRLYLKLEELKDRKIITVSDGPMVLLRQFNYGCIDDSIILKLRLEEKEDDPPDYGSLLLALRKEEAKRTKKTLVQKYARSQAMTQKEDDDMIKLRKEVEALKAQLAQAKPKSPSKETSPPKEQMKKTSTTSKSDQSQGAKKKLRFCFKCGEDGHVVWKCNNPPNTDLVSKKFEDARTTQEN